MVNNYSDLRYFQGSRYQRGRGFFGRIMSRMVFPFLKYIGGKALDTGKTIARDVLDGKDLKSSAKTRVLDTVQTVANEGISKMRGKGIRRKTIKRPKRKRKPKKYDFLK